MELYVNPTTYPSTRYPESERILEIKLHNNYGGMNEVFAKVDLDMDGRLPEGLETTLAYRLRRLYGEPSLYAGYEDVTDLFADDESEEEHVPTVPARMMRKNVRAYPRT